MKLTIHGKDFDDIKRQMAEIAGASEAVSEAFSDAVAGVAVGAQGFVNAVTPLADQIAETQTLEDDLPWDERIHSSAKKLNKDGTWKKRRGVNVNRVATVETELRAAVNARRHANARAQPATPPGQAVQAQPAQPATPPGQAVQTHPATPPGQAVQAQPAQPATPPGQAVQTQPSQPATTQEPEILTREQLSMWVSDLVMDGRTTFTAIAAAIQAATNLSSIRDISDEMVPVAVEAVRGTIVQ